MQIRTGTRLYNLWLMTFDIGMIFGDVNRPEYTTRRQFRLRIAHMLFPILAFIVVAVLWMFMETILGNALTILSGNGVWITWERPGSHLRRFHPMRIADVEFKSWFLNIKTTMWLNTRTFAAFLWFVVMATVSWYLWSHSAIFEHIAAMTIRDVMTTLGPLWNLLSWVGIAAVVLVIAIIIALKMMRYADEVEYANQARVRQIIKDAEESDTPLPPEIVTFTDAVVDKCNCWICN